MIANPLVAVGSALVILSGLNRLKEKAEIAPSDRDEILAKLEQAEKELETLKISASSEQLENLTAERDKLKNKLKAFRSAKRAKERIRKNSQEKTPEKPSKEEPKNDELSD